MAIKPIDLRRKEFKSSLRGYDHNQVDDFLDSVADEFERTYTDNVRMRDEISSLRERLQQFEDLEGSIRSALVHAEQASNDLRESARRESEATRENARREADLTVKEAQNHAHQMLSDSSSRVERIQESYEALREARQTFAADFRHLLQSYASVMDNMDVASAKEIEASLRGRLDTESIAAAREAASRQDDSQPQLTDTEESEEAGPLDEDTSEESADTDATQVIGDAEEEAPSSDATQPITAQSSEYEPPEYEMPDRNDEDDDSATGELGTRESEEIDREPEVSEPEVEPSSVQGETDDTTVASESPAAEEVDQEEPAFETESQSDDFFDRGQREESSRGSSGDEEKDSRIFRASRFLRRRDS